MKYVQDWQKLRQNDATDILLMFSLFTLNNFLPSLSTPLVYLEQMTAM